MENGALLTMLFLGMDWISGFQIHGVNQVEQLRARHYLSAPSLLYPRLALEGWLEAVRDKNNHNTDKLGRPEIPGHLLPFRECRGKDRVLKSLRLGFRWVCSDWDKTSSNIFHLENMISLVPLQGTSKFLVTLRQVRSSRAILRSSAKVIRFNAISLARSPISQPDKLWCWIEILFVWKNLMGCWIITRR